MTEYTSPILNIQQIEASLSILRDQEQQARAIDRLTSVYAYTDIQRAKELLKQQRAFLKKHPLQDLDLNFHLNSAFIENQFYNYPLAEHHLKKALTIIENQGDLKMQAETYIDYAGICINLERLDEANNYLEQASKHLKVYPDPILSARITCREGFINLHYSNYSKAIELLLEADKEINTNSQTITLKDYYFLTLIYSGLGNIYERNKDLEKAVKHYKKVMEICQVTGMKTRLSWHYLNIGKGYIGMNNIDNAEKYLRKAIKITDMVDPAAQAGAYANLGFCYYLRENYEEALKLYDRAEHIYQSKVEGNYINFSVIESWKAQLYADKGQRDLSEKHFIRAFEFAKLRGDLQQLSAICKSIAQFYAQATDFKNAYEYQVLYADISAKATEQIHNKKALELEVKYETEKRKQEAKMLRLQATSLQLKALRAQMNPHFMYNALNSIQNYITSNEIKSAAKYLAKFAKLMRQSLDYSDLEIISLEKEIEFLDDYLSINQKLRFKDKLDYKITIDDEIEEDILGVPTMIVQPYVENAIEHGLRTKENGLVEIDFQLKDDYTILCKVQDNGIGRKKAKELKEKDEAYLNHQSRGTVITEDRLRILHNSRMNHFFVKTVDLYQKDTRIPLGTRVEILIPIVEVQVK